MAKNQWILMNFCEDTEFQYLSILRILKSFQKYENYNEINHNHTN